MKERDVTLEERLRALRVSAVPVDQRDPARDDLTVRRIELCIVAEAARKQRFIAVRRFALAAAAVFAISGIGFASWRLGRDMGERSVTVAEAALLEVRGSSGTVVVQQGAGPRLLEPNQGASLRAGDRIETLADGRVELASDHTSWKVQRATVLELVGTGRTGERVRLTQGRIDVDVRHAKERNVVVETPHAEVLVVGTAFRVSVDGSGDARRTEVSVERGTVWILQNGERKAVLSAGQRWSSPARLEALVRPAPSEQPGPVSSPPSSGSSDAGTLAEENRLFRSALDARNRGNDARAAELFAELLRRFPRSVVGEEASLGRMRALLRQGRRAEAEGEARRYLGRYPGGHARSEAEKVLEGSKSER